MRKYQLTINDKQITVNLRELTAEAAEVEVDGTNYRITIDAISQDRDSIEQTPPRSLANPAPTASPAPAASQTGNSDGVLCAPIPGSILALYVKVGDSVKAGQPLFKMEAMKMENEINSRINGTVTAILVSAGDSVAQGQELIHVSPAEHKRRQSDQ
jgi:biotin carboxyl carrier protein